jgi:hypothetical protein
MLTYAVNNNHQRKQTVLVFLIVRLYVGMLVDTLCYTVATTRSNSYNEERL